jgi:hypothetical protein
VVQKDIFYKGRELKLSDPQGFKMEAFIADIKKGMYTSGKIQIKNEDNQKMTDQETKKRDPLNRFGFDEGSVEAQAAYKKNILNPETMPLDQNRRTKWVADGFTNMTKENLPIPQRAM